MFRVRNTVELSLGNSASPKLASLRHLRFVASNSHLVFCRLAQALPIGSVGPASVGLS